MKKLLFIVAVLVSLVSNAQEKNLQILTNEKEIAFLIEKDGKIFENYILKFEKESYKDLSGKYGSFDIVFDSKNGLLSLKIDAKIYYFATNTEVKLKNINYCIGIAKRTGDFKIVKDFKQDDSFYNGILGKDGSYSNVIESVSCPSGGPGSTSCSSEVTIGPVTTKCDVSCGAGYYSCCSLGSCDCKPYKKVPHLSAERFALVVNPTKNLLTFNGKDFSKYKIRIFDLRSGEMFINNIVLSEEINISILKAGIYAYNIYDNAGYEQNGKVIVKD